MTFEVTIPVLNEAGTLQRQVRLLHSFLTKQFPEKESWKIVIADNGSEDETIAIAKRLASRLSNLRIVSTKSRGVGLALKTSWLSSKAEIIGYMDLDLATATEHISETMDHFQKGDCDLLYATRLHPQSKVINRPLKREVTSRAFNFILKNYLGTCFSDGMCGFKFLKREILNQLLENGAKSDGWFFSTELLAVAEWQGLNIRELPVTWTDDTSGSKVNIFKLTKEYLKAMQVLKTFKPNLKPA